jgi:hypothetical protein
MTFAVFRPTPGSSTSASSVAGTSPAWRSWSAAETPSRLFALLRKKPVVFTSSSTSSRFAAASAAGVGYVANSFGVTMLTRLSVHCALRIVATSSWNGVSKSSEHLAPG